MGGPTAQFCDIILIEGVDDMKVCISLLSIVSIVMLLSSCGLGAIPIESPKIDEFEEYYVGDDFTVLIRSEIDPDMPYEQVAYVFRY